MSKSDTLVKFLRAHRGQYFCDRCLSEKTGITPLAQVNQLARPLEHAKEYRRFKTTCSGCTKDRLALGYFGLRKEQQALSDAGLSKEPTTRGSDGRLKSAMRECRFCRKDIEDAATICPHCGRDLIPGRQTASAMGTPTTSTLPPTVKTCPFCAEEIQAAAIVCKHCHKDLAPVVTAAPVAAAPAKKTGCLTWIVVFVGLILIGLLRSLMTPTPSTPSTPITVRAPRVVEYHVSGTSIYSDTSHASLTYQNASGGTEQEDVTLPWTCRVGETRSGQYFYISAQRSSLGTVVVEIVIDGTVVKHSESSGEYAIASASGRF